MEQKEIKPVAIDVDYPGDDKYMGNESYLINSHTGYHLGQQGDHRLLTVNMDSEMMMIYEAVSGNDRYPPGRNMHVQISHKEFEAIAAIYQARLARAEELHARQKVARSASGVGDDFDPFLDSDDLP